jgi:hypothetical protein
MLNSNLREQNDRLNHIIYCIGWFISYFQNYLFDISMSSLFVFYQRNVIHSVCETPYVAESESPEEDNSGSDTLDSQLELRSTFGDESRKYKFSL